MKRAHFGYAVLSLMQRWGHTRHNGGLDITLPGRSTVNKRFLLQMIVVLVVVLGLALAAPADAWVPVP